MYMHKVLRASINICGSNHRRKITQPKRLEKNSDKTETSSKQKKREEKLFFFVFVFKNKIFEFYGNPSSPNKLYPAILPFTRF